MDTDGKYIMKGSIMSFRKKLAIGAATGILVVAGGVAVLAQVNASDQESTTTTVAAASDRGAGGERVSRLRQSLEDLVTDGTLTAAQADAVAEHLENTSGHGAEGRGDDGGISLDVAAETIGIEESALLDAIGDGETIAEVAIANGIDAAVVIDALVAADQVKLDEQVADGSITAEVADEKAAEALDRITGIVNGTIEFRSGSGSRSDAPADRADSDGA